MGFSSADAAGFAKAAEPCGRIAKTIHFARPGGRKGKGIAAMLSIRTVVSALIILAICNLETPGQLLGQVSLPLKVDDAVRTQILSEVSPLALSPDGRRLAYMVQESGVIRPLKDSATETYIRTGVYVRNQAGNILLTDLETLETKNLTNGIGSNWEPRWSPDGRYLAFLSNRDGSRQAKIWIWDSFSGGLRMVSDVCVRAVSLINRLTWTPDSKHVLITVIPEGMSVESYENFVLSPAIELSTATAIVPGSSVILYEGNAAGPATNKEPSATPLRLDSQFLHDLVLVDVTTGQRTVIVHGKWIRWYELSPDGTQVAYTSLNEFSRERSLNLPCDVISVHLFSKKERILASHVRAFGLSWSPDSKTISYGAYAADDRTYDYYVVDAGEGHRVRFLPCRDRRRVAVSWVIPCGRLKVLIFIFYATVHFGEHPSPGVRRSSGYEFQTGGSPIECGSQMGQCGRATAGSRRWLLRTTRRTNETVSTK